MKIRSLMLATILALAAVESTAQEAAGRWAVNFDSDFGPVAFTFEFMLDDKGSLVGSMTNEFGSIPIEDGVIDGNDISFKLTLDFGQGPATFAYKGTVSGDEIQMTSTFAEPPAGFESFEQRFTAKRAE